MKKLLNKICILETASVVATVVASTLGTICHADNPIIQTKFTADPAPMVFSNTVYLYTSHDEDDAFGFKMCNWMLSWQRTTNTAMAVTIDCGDANDIHPAHKQPVGARLALAARALAYGEKIEYSGPLFESLNVKGANAVLHFTHLGGGLVAKDGGLKGFTIAGADKVFHPAQAKIVGETVVVNSAEVSQPVAVRYGWANVPEGNLFNQTGLPASPFRSDAD